RRAPRATGPRDRPTGRGGAARRGREIAPARARGRRERRTERRQPRRVRGGAGTLGALHPHVERVQDAVDAESAGEDDQRDEGVRSAKRRETGPAHADDQEVAGDAEYPDRKRGPLALAEQRERREQRQCQPPAPSRCEGNRAHGSNAAAGWVDDVSDRDPLVENGALLVRAAV